MDLAFEKDAFAARNEVAVPADAASMLHDAFGPAAGLGALDDIPHMIWIADRTGRSFRANSETRQFVGLPAAGNARDALRAKLVHPDELLAVGRQWRAALATGKSFESTFRIRHHGGSYRWVSCRARPQCDEAGNALNWYGTLTEIHEAVVAEQNLREVRNIRDNILEASSDCIKILDLDGTLRQINDYGVMALEFESRAAVIGSNWATFWPGIARRKAAEAIRNAASGRTSRFTGQAFTQKGAPCWWDNILTPVRDANGVPHSILCISRNMTDQKLAAEGLRLNSERDALTRLPNRRSFERHLKRTISRARDKDGSIALLLVDLDHFKSLNDTLGHLAGDHLLRIFGRRLLSYASDKLFVARLGGDEFAIVLSGADEQTALDLAGEILRRGEEPVTFGGRCVNGGISIGCAIYPRDAVNARELFRLADTALYDMKAGGRGGVQLFNPAMLDAAEDKARQLDLARRAINQRTIVPWYQPKVALEDGRITGFEALLRVDMPGAGLQLPEAIAAAFSEYDLASRISVQMQDKVFADIAGLLDRGVDPGVVSINASPVEFLRDDYAEQLLARIERFGIKPERIELEITEHGLLDRGARYVMRALTVLSAAGVRIALDDFGTGNASLTHLREFPVNSLKIDKSFIARMMTRPETLAIVQAIVSLGSALSIEIVAEGIETPEQLHILLAAGCNTGQGYLFGRAMPFHEMEKALVAQERPFRRLAGQAG